MKKMSRISFEELPEFLKDLKQLLKKYRTLESDLEALRKNPSISADTLANLEGTVKGFDKPKTMLYDLILNAKNLETGKWVGRDSMLGLINGRIVLKGNNGFCAILCWILWYYSI